MLSEESSHYFSIFLLRRGSMLVHVPVQKWIAPVLHEKTIEDKYKLEEVEVQVLVGTTI